MRGEHAERDLGDLGAEAVRFERGPNAAHHGEIITGGFGGAEHRTLQPEQTDPPAE